MKRLSIVFAALIFLGCGSKGHGGTATPADDQYCPPEASKAYAIIDIAAATQAKCVQTRVHKGVPASTPKGTAHTEYVVWCCPTP